MSCCSRRRADRRLIFEEAAGISRFKAKKIESLRRLERVEQNLLRLGDIVAEVEHRLRQVRLQAAKARRYKEYSDRLQQLRTHVGMTDWRTWSARIAEMESELAALTAERDEASRAAGQRDTSAAGEETNVATTSEAIRTSEARRRKFAKESPRGKPRATITACAPPSWKRKPTDCDVN